MPGGRDRGGWLRVITHALERIQEQSLASQLLPTSAVLCPGPQVQVLLWGKHQRLHLSLAWSCNTQPQADPPETKPWRVLPKGQPSESQLLLCSSSVDLNFTKSLPKSTWANACQLPESMLHQEMRWFAGSSVHPLAWTNRYSLQVRLNQISLCTNLEWGQKSCIWI